MIQVIKRGERSIDFIHDKKIIASFLMRTHIVNRQLEVDNIELIFERVELFTNESRIKHLQMMNLVNQHCLEITSNYIEKDLFSYIDLRLDYTMPSSI